MPISAVLFDLDDTLLWDDRSVNEAFRSACEAAGDTIDPQELELAVRKEAIGLYESYETNPFTKMIGINPFEALWGTLLQVNSRNSVNWSSLHRDIVKRHGVVVLQHLV